MFAGIVQSVQPVIAATVKDRCRAVRIRTPRGWKVAEGQSISIDGICSTVARRGRGYFEVEYMPMTLARTTAGRFAEGAKLNLERPLKMSDFVDGHFVAGHVDALSRVLTFKKTGTAGLLTIALPKALRRFVAVRGSIAINGVSLTVAAKGSGAVTVALIPHTLSRTNLGALARGDAVNVEVDMLARLAFAAREAGGRVILHAAKRARTKGRITRRGKTQGGYRARGI